MTPGWKSRLGELMRSPAVAALFVGAGVTRFFWVVWVMRPPNVQLDFSTFWIAAFVIRRHKNPYQLDLTPFAMRHGVVIGPLLHANQPPTFFLLFEPLAHYQPWTAYWIWCIATIVILLLTLYLLFGANKVMPIPTVLILISLALMFRGVQKHFEFQQVQILLLFLLVVLLRALMSGNDIGAGAALALAGLLRGYPLFMALYLICARKWRALGYTALGLVVGFGVTVALLGSMSFWFFDTVVLHVNPKGGYVFIPTIGMAGSFYRISQYFSPNDANRAIVEFRRAANIVSELIIIALTGLAIARARDDRYRAEYAFGLCAVAMVLCDSNSWAHYMVFFFLPFSQIAVATELGIAPMSAPMLAALAYVLNEVSYAANYYVVRRDNLTANSWLIEGMFVATLLVYVASYILTTRASPSLNEESAGDEESACAQTPAYHS